MRYAKAIVLFVLVVCSVSLFAQDDGLVNTPVAPAQSSTIMYVVSNILAILAVPVAAGISALIHCILAAVLAKFKLQINQQQQDVLTGAAETAVAKAEAWATAQKDTPSGNAKLNFAVSTMRDMITGTSLGQTTNSHLSHYVEEAVYKLFNQVDPNDPVPVVPPAAKV